MESNSISIPSNYGVQFEYPIFGTLITRGYSTPQYVNFAGLISDSLVKTTGKEAISPSVIWIKSMERAILQWLFPAMTLAQAEVQMPLWRLLSSDVGRFMYANQTYYTTLQSCYNDFDLEAKYYPFTPQTAYE